MTDRPSRSGQYQYKIVETNVSTEFLSSFTNQNSIYYHLNPFQYDERVLDLREKLRDKFWSLAEQVCTERQYIVLRLCADGYTQMEIAAKLNVNQSSVTKTINGNVDYKHGTRVYGGFLKKLRIAVQKNEEIQKIIAEINELSNEVN